MSNAPLDHWLEKIESIHPEEIELGLQRVSSVASALGLLPLASRVVTVAGTNGKGSVVAILEALALESGYTCGAFTSPHFLRFNERIRLSGEEVDDGTLIAAFEAIELAREDTPLTYFEYTALAALFVFKSIEPDIVVLEVGLGGRLDAVNIVEATVAVVTSIDLDHQVWLGDTRGAIAREKAGIMRTGVPAVIGETDPPPELEQAARDVGADPIILIGRDYKIRRRGDAWYADLRSTDGREFALEGAYPGDLVLENIGTALQAALLTDLAFDPRALAAAPARARPTGRRESRSIDGREYILDVAHNPASVGKLVEHLNTGEFQGRTIAVFAVMADKDLEAMLAASSGQFDAWFLADLPGNERAARASDVAGQLNAAGHSMISISKNLRQALRRAESVSSAGDRLVIFGSFFTVAAALPLLEMGSNRNGAPG